MVEQHAVQLEGLCRPQGIKLLYVRSYGLLGSLRVSIPCLIPRFRVQGLGHQAAVRAGVRPPGQPAGGACVSVLGSQV